jgi:hypothetical protein
MKKIFSFIVLLAGITLSASAHAQSKANWKEMNDFHGVMSTTFHPAEEGDLEPIKKRSQEMIDKAVAWQQSTAPEGYDKKAAEETLKKLVKESRNLHKMIKAGSPDKEIVAKLTALHDIFHEIMEKCTGEGHH